jgi:DNA primase
MTGRIRDEDLALVRERSPIDEVIGEYLQLRGSGGGSMTGLCPFHEEKTPSFNVTPARGLFYCFGCQQAGDVIDFVRKIDSLGFVEAVERLAQRAGIELRYEQGGNVPGREQSQRRRLLAAHRAAAKFYAEQLATPAAAEGRAFLSERGFSAADAEHFRVGYAPADWDVLTRYLRRQGFTDAELLSGGLASQGRRGLIDKFRGRLIWPIADLTGDVIAFGARRLAAGDDGPKYLNTPETVLFKKSTVLYGADLARRDIAQRRQVVLVEGYTDVMACHLAGITTAVATCGTSFGDGHVTIVRRLLMDDSQFRGEIIFTFDGDAAGERAALRAFSMEERFVTQTFVAAQGDGLDPCDLRVKQGDAAVRDLIAQRVPLFEFAIRSALSGYNLETSEGRLAALDAAAPIVSKIKDRGLRQLYAINLDRWLGMMDEQFVLDRVRAHGGADERAPRDRGRGPGRSGPAGRNQETAGSPARVAGNGSPARAQAGSGYDAADPVVSVEKQALKLAIQRPALCGPAFDELSAAAFIVPAHAAVRELMAACGGVSLAGTARDWASKLREAAPNDNARAFITRLAVEPIEAPGNAGEPDSRYAGAVMARVEELAVSRDIAVTKSRLQRMSPVTQQTEYNRTFGDLMALELRRKVLLQRIGGEL